MLAGRNKTNVSNKVKTINYNESIKKPALRRINYNMGRPTGLEPANAGTTTRCVDQLRHDRRVLRYNTTNKIICK